MQVITIHSDPPDVTISFSNRWAENIHVCLLTEQGITINYDQSNVQGIANYYDPLSVLDMTILKIALFKAAHRD